MTSLRFPIPAVSIAAVAFAATPAFAFHHRHHHRTAATPPPYGAEAYYPHPNYYGGWQAEAIARATAAEQAAPGVTNELAPDAKETATGGPVGGVPGFSGR